MFIIDNYDVTNVVSNTEKNNKLSISQVRENVRDIAMENILSNDTEKIFQTDYGKFIIPIDYNGKISLVEMSFVVKKDDYDLENAINNFEIRKQNSIKDDIKNNEIKELKKEITKKRNEE